MIKEIEIKAKIGLKTWIIIFLIGIFMGWGFNWQLGVAAAIFSYVLLRYLNLLTQLASIIASLISRQIEETKKQ